MRITINAKPVDQLTPKQEKTFFLSKKQDEVKGRILTREEATALHVAQIKRWYAICGSFVGSVSTTRRGFADSLRVAIVRGSFSNGGQRRRPGPNLTDASPAMPQMAQHHS